MYDVFISHSSKDKKIIVEPLVKELEKRGLQVWLDSNCLLRGDLIKNSIIKGINESVVFLAVISDNFFESNWTSLELGVLQTIPLGKLIPLIFKKDIAHIALRYPFLLEHNYIELDTSVEILADKIQDVICQKKQECGLWYINKTNFKHLIREIHSYNNFKLDQIAIRLGLVEKTISLDIYAAIKDILSIVELILKDVAYRENIYISEDKSPVDLFTDIEFLNYNLKEHIKFLSQLCVQRINGIEKHPVWIQEDLYLTQFSIYSIIEWYMLSYFRKPTLSNKKIIPVAPEEFSEEDILEPYEIEKLVLPPELIASPTTDMEWFVYNPLTMIGARDIQTGKLIGFFNTLPISDELYHQILTGEFDDTKICVDSIRQYDMPGFYKLYLCSFCIHPAYNTSTAFKEIYTSFIDFLLNLATEREIFISDIIADGVTLKGANLCESIGMKKLKSTNHKSNIYIASLIPPEFSTLKLNNRAGKKLIAYYENIYNNYKDVF